MKPSRKKMIRELQWGRHLLAAQRAAQRKGRIVQTVAGEKRADCFALYGDHDCKHGDCSPKE